ncbi:MAG: tetratricopeptide repeat protein [Paludibacteraceae bacterium]|nr:tetratricopeptide repeat protein [Paludibacteraceae bacterium]
MRKILIILTSLLAIPAFAQRAGVLVERGNRQYEQGHYDQAVTDYKRALNKRPQSVEANYNLGNACFRQQVDSQAVRQYHQALQLCDPSDKQTQADLWHNIGNAHYHEAAMLRQQAAYGMNQEALSQSGKSLDKAIAAYQQSLRLNPEDDETRYNLVIAKRLKEQQSQSQQSQQNKQQNQQDQNQEQQNQQDQQEEQKDQQAREQAASLLDAIDQEEAKVEKTKTKEKSDEKDW